jgi:carbonic anhydrase
MADSFSDIVDANRAYAQDFVLEGLDATAAKGLAVLTCIDSRIEPLTMLGLVPGDAKILRNAGARVTEDAIRSLVLAANLLGVTRIMVVGHTDCAVAGTTDDEIRTELAQLHPHVDVSSFEPLASERQLQTMRDDLTLLREHPLLTDVAISAWRYDVDTGLLEPVSEIASPAAP